MTYEDNIIAMQNEEPEEGDPEEINIIAVQDEEPEDEDPEEIDMDADKYEITVPASAAGMRADRYLADVLPELSRSRLQELIRDGQAMIGDKPLKSSRKLNTGDIIILRIPELKDPEILPEDIPLDILYEDEDVMIVNKPKGMTVHPAPGHSSGTLVNAVMYHCRGNLSGINGVLRPGIVHRIDKDTTGALIICKNDVAHRKIAEQLAVHSITREYLGIVTGNIKEDSGTIEGNIGRDPRERKRMAVVKVGGKPAVTHYRVLERFGNYTFCAFKLETGRTHQIRVHMASKGHPLLGDTVYSSGRSPYPTEGQTLHAATIGFIHPRTGEYVEFTTPLPAYFKNILKRLRDGR